MIKKQKTLIGILRNEEEGAIFLYFKEGTIFRFECDVKNTTDDQVIENYCKYGQIEKKIKNVIKRFKNLI